MMTNAQHSPYIFDEFFASGREESISPFLTPTSRWWGKNLSLKSAFLSAFFLALSFATSFFYPPLVPLLLSIVYFLSGTPALIDALEDLKNFEINIDVLMTLAALLSVMIGSAMEGALLLVLFELSASIENAVTEKTKSALSQLHQLSPKMAYVIAEDGSLIERSIQEITVGTLLLIKAGEIVPLDGIVTQGSSFVNLAHLSGESLPISKEIGDEVPAGSRNLDGTLTIRVLRTSSDSTLSRIIQLITHAVEAKPRLERLLDRFGKWYATGVILLFLFFAATLSWFLSIPYLGPEGGIYRALTFLIAASPCALILATPTAYLSAISSCARKGILLKGGITLDALASCRLAAFDKTGTLTTGQLRCISIDYLGEKDPSCDLPTALAIAASLERHVVHPIAEAILHFAKAQKIPYLEIDHFKSHPGRGLEALVQIHDKAIPVYIGHADFISSKISPKKFQEWEALKKEVAKRGHLDTILLVGEALFVFHFAETLRSQIKELLHRLKITHQLQLAMLTGDNLENAKDIADQIGIDRVFANLRPEDKLLKVSELSAKNGLIMVGDGINDAPALARATVGISLGKVGSRTAMDASDIVFLHDDLTSLDWLMEKAHQTMRILRQNLFIALGIITLATIPALLGVVPLWAAVLLHEGGTMLVGLNSLRLLKC